MVTDLSQDEKLKNIFYTAPPPRSQIYEKGYVSEAKSKDEAAPEIQPVVIVATNPNPKPVKAKVELYAPKPIIRGKYKYTGEYRPTNPKRRIPEKAKMQRRKLVDALQKKGHNSREIAELLNEPRGTIWHDILWLRKNPIREKEKIELPQITIVKK